MFLGLLQQRLQVMLLPLVETALDVLRQIHGEPFSRQLAATELFHTRSHGLLKLRHDAGAFQIVWLDLATVNRLAIAFMQPMDQGLAGANAAVITVSRTYRPLLDALKQTLVLIKRTLDQIEALTRQTFGFRAFINYHSYPQADYSARVRRRGVGLLRERQSDDEKRQSQRAPGRKIWSAAATTPLWISAHLLRLSEFVNHDPKRRRAATLQRLQIRTARKFQKRQTHTTDEYLIGTDRRRRREAVTTGSRNQIILIHAVATDADAADQHSILVERHAARKNLNTVRQVWNRRTWLRCAGEGREQIGLNQVQLQTDIERTPFIQRSAEGTGLRIVDSIRKERAMQKPAGPICECH